MTVANRTPWFVGDRAFVPGYPYEWVVLLLVGEFALIGKVEEVRVLGQGSFARLVPVEKLVRPGQWDAANLSQVKVVAKAIPGAIYERRLGIYGQHGEELALYVGLLDGRVYGVVSPHHGAQDFNPDTMKRTPFVGLD